jgi:putative Ca2+/H+ antiporter (TMEM165/GDT1 family)
MKPDEGQEEFEEVSAELKKREENGSGEGGDVEEGTVLARPPLHRRLRCLACLAPIFLQAFTLTFLAEWGDRSQLTTIVLSAREDPVGVTLGGTFGHALCTALAVLGGKIIAQRISVRTVTFIGGVVFLIFALSAFIHDPNSSDTTSNTNET